jgi:homoserine kinase type II
MEVLSALRESTLSLAPEASRPFLFQDYCRTLIGQIQKYRLPLLPRLQPFLTVLEHSLFALEAQFPFCFCHGDLHPLNILWGENSIHALIDWEFAGFKAEAYDLANFLGSIGFEDPEAFFSPLVRDLLRQIHAEKHLSDLSIFHLGHWILALRFAWLSEWLRKGEEELLEQELSYMEILLDNLGDLNAYFRQK